MSGQRAHRWTDEQYDAIVSDGSNILVAAAAGSGKTAVLVERIIQKIAANTDVDRLLVATFTNAAAAEMKDRIRVALEKKLEENPSSEHLRKQLALMGKSSITTLHSFCMEVIRKHYSLIGLDPGFRIANETEIELIRADIMEQLFESRYALSEGAGAFLELVNSFGGERGDDPLYGLVERLYLFTRSHPWPHQWLEQMAAAYQVETIEQLEETMWVQQIKEEVFIALAGAQDSFMLGLELTRLPAGPYAYASTFDADIEAVVSLQEQLKGAPWSQWSAIFAAVSFEKLAAMRGKEHDPLLQDQAKQYREQGKTAVQHLIIQYFGRTAEQFLYEIQQLAPLMDELVKLVKEFGDQFEQEKRSKALLDFGDLEHYCLAILLDPLSSADQLIPSEAALEYQAQFDEILLDEYQDTNRVQETIVELISKTTQGNRFMVGDVKQSIYRFRLAEPNLFLQKYKTYGQETTGDNASGKRIDLARNFRSRNEIVDAVNYVFRAIMQEKVAEMEYDERAELVFGAAYYAPPESLEQCKVECTIINREARQSPDDTKEQEVLSNEDESEALARKDRQEQQEEMKIAELEAKYISQELQRLKAEHAQVYDVKSEQYRDMEWKDTVILLRATSSWAPIFIEELKLAGIPAYSNIGSGYFEAVEVETILSCLQIIDNPYQDIPLAATLRSPLFGLTAEELSQIRILSLDAAYYDAVNAAAGSDEMTMESRKKLSQFLFQLEIWRNKAREGSLSDLLWDIYQETAYYDFVGGLPGGLQRQANLRALYDRARQYEATSFRGLFRFLKFIERMRNNGNDLGVAQAIGEQEDVVKIMTAHASKGLEFPIVFVAGLGKKFNEQDLNKAFLYHKDFGFGPKYVDTNLRITYPSLSYLSIRRAMRMELLAEEMRILYVALTRPKEKLYLVGTLSSLEKKLPKWQSASNDEGKVQPAVIASAASYLDWLGPIVAGELAASLTAADERRYCKVHSEYDWLVQVKPAAELVCDGLNEQTDPENSEKRKEIMQALHALAQLEDIPQDETLRRKLESEYAFKAATTLAAKSTITEMKRVQAAFTEEEPAAFMPMEETASKSLLGEFTLQLRRPAFMEEKKLTPTERGSINHLIMQHVPLDSLVDAETVERTISRMLEQKLITELQQAAIQSSSIVTFFESELGQRMLAANWIKRELPFSFLVPAHKAYKDIDQAASKEQVLIQGIIDCLFEDENGLVLIDYKTDRIAMGNWAEKAEEHRFQLEMYAEAIQSIVHCKVKDIYVFFFDGAKSVKL